MRVIPLTTASRILTLLLLTSMATALVAVVASRQQARFVAHASLEFADSTFNSDVRRWAGREADKLEEHGDVLIASVLGDDPSREIDTRLDNTKMTVQIVSDCRTCASRAANVALEILASDYIRRQDPALHEALRSLEREQGLPSPPDPQRPNQVDDTETRDAESANSNGHDLSALRNTAIGQELDGLLSPSTASTEDQPNVATDAAEAAVVAIVLGGAVLFGPTWWFGLVAKPISVRNSEGGPRRPWTGAMTAVALVTASSLLAIVPLIGGLTPAIFAALSCVAIVRLRNDRTEAVSLALFLWLLAGLAGRLMSWNADVDAGLAWGAPVLASVLLVVLCIAPPMSADRPPEFLGWLLVPLMIAFGVGIIENGLAAASTDAANWVAPLFIIIVVSQPEWRADALDAIHSWFLLGVVVAATYGIVQYVVVPPWDSAWLDTASVASFGSPERFDVRVFSTASSPAAAGFFAAMSLIVVTCVPDVRSRMLYIAASLVLLGLTLHRTSWLAVLAGLVAVAALQRGRNFGSARGWIAGSVAAVALVAAVPGIRERFSDTLNAGLRDRSLSTRWTTYVAEFPELIRDPVGRGFGATGAGARAAESFAVVHDSAALDLLATFGSPFAVLSILMIAVTLRRSSPHIDLSGSATEGLAMLTVVAAAIPFLNVFTGLQGVVTWAALSVFVGATRYETRVVGAR